MWWTIAMILLVLWTVAFFGTQALGGLINVLAVVAILVVLVKLLRSWRSIV